MRLPAANCAFQRLCRLRFCALRPLPRPLLHNDYDRSRPSSTITLFSTSSACSGSAKDQKYKYYRKKVKKQQARKGVEVQSAGTAPAKDGSAGRDGGAPSKKQLGNTGGNSDESELDFSEESLKLSRTIQLPTPQELSQLPGGSNGFQKAMVPRTIFAAVEALGGTCSEKHYRLSYTGKRFFRTEITIQFLPNKILIATGDGYTREQAMRAAGLHAIAKMRDEGLLTLSGSAAQEEVGDEDAMLDIYNYAARYRCVPSVAIRQFKRFFSITVDMPEQGINVAINNVVSLPHGEAAAAREFKRQAELYHLRKGSDSVVVRDRHTLSHLNAKDFFRFCRDSGENLGKLDVAIQPRGDLWVARPRFEDLALDLEFVPEVSTRRKVDTETAAYLVAALSVIKMKPHLFDEFSKALRAGNGKYLDKLGPKDVILDPGVVRELNTIQTLEWSDRAEKIRRPNAQFNSDVSREYPLRRALTPEQLATKSAQLQNRLDEYRTRADLTSLREARAQLPMAQYASRVRQIVHDNVYCVIVGATGSGKTTQVPQILLDEAIENGTGASCNVICTQPRRIAATSVARRVAGERAENLQETVGYQVRFDAKRPSPGGSILYCTTGILLQQLQHNPDDVLDHVSHLVIDEVHERDMIIDYLLITLKNTMAARAARGKKLPRVVLMSATIDPEQFAAYFRNSLPSEKSSDCPTLTVPGRTFPVQEHYLDDTLRAMRGEHGERQLDLLRTDKATVQYLKVENSAIVDAPATTDNSIESIIDWKNQATFSGENADSVDDALVPLGLAATTVAHITKTSKGGAILVFLPGLDEIIKLDKLLREESPLGVDFSDAQRFQIIMLHSSIQDSQKTVFDPVQEDCRKIILSTNIAETSVTIPDVQFVVDTGKSREKRYDQTRRITQLQCTWISKSNAKQRAGRAGRVQNGVYYALFTRARRESMRAIGLPELLRSDLQETCLDIKAQAFKMPVADFLAGAMEPPTPSAVDTAMQNLTSLGALTEDEELTPLGSILASLPVHPTLGKMILLGIIFRCLDPMIILGAAAHDRPFFTSPLEQRSTVDGIKKEFAGKSGSDHIMLWKAFQEAREMSAHGGARAYHHFRENFFSQAAFKSIDRTAREIVNILTEAGLIERQDTETMLRYGGRRLNDNSNSEALVKALLVAGLYPNFAVPNSPRSLRTTTEKETTIHPGSVNKEMRLFGKHFIFNSLSLSNDGKSMFLRETSSVTPLIALLFGGPLVQRGPILEMDQWLPMFIKHRPVHGGITTHKDNRTAADQVMFLRRLLDRMLASAFDDLASQVPLATGDRMRAELVFRLAKVLNLEAGEMGKLRPPGMRTQEDDDDVMTSGAERGRRNGSRKEKRTASTVRRGVQARMARRGSTTTPRAGGGRGLVRLRRGYEAPDRGGWSDFNALDELKQSYCR